MIKIEFPADRPDLARAFGEALTRIGAGAHSDDLASMSTAEPDNRATEGGFFFSEDGDTGYAIRQRGDGPCEMRLGFDAEWEPTPEWSLDHLRDAFPLANGADPITRVDERAYAEFEQGICKSVAATFDDPKPSEADESGEAIETDGTAQTAEPDSDAPTLSAVRVDEHGVEFNAAFCAEAAEPFYTTGKQSGQWKKRRGVDEGEYVKWYESQLGGTPAPAPVEPEADSITDAPSLFVWVSEMQTAGRLTQDDVAAAWQEAGVTDPTQLFTDGAAPLVASIYQYLSARA